MCRAQRPFELERVGSVGHLYFLSFGQGDLLGYERTCTECATSFAAEEATYASKSRQLVSLLELKRLTFPNLDVVRKAHIAQEEKIRTSLRSFSAAERYSLVKAPFMYLVPKVQLRFSSTHLDWGVGVAFLAGIGVLSVTPLIVERLFPDSAAAAFLAAAALSVGLVFWQIHECGNRFMKRNIVPVLANALRPLRPTSQEIQRVIGELKQARAKLGIKLRAGDLARGMQAG